MIIFVVLIPVMGLIIELLFQRPLEKRIWNWILFFFIIGFSHALGSRCVGCSPYDDYANIYEFQGELLQEHGLFSFFSLDAAQTNEFIFYAIFKILTVLLPQNYWLAGFAFLSMFLINSALRNYLHPKEILILLALSSIGLSTQLIRQYLAWSFLLFVLTRTSGRLYMPYIVGSFFIHHTSLIFYAKYLAIKYLKWKIIIVGLLIVLSFEVLMSFLLNVDYYSIQYLTSEVGLDPLVLDYNKIFIPRIWILALLVMITAKYRDYSLITWYVILSISLFIITFSLPLVPVRVNLLLLSNSIGLCVIALNRFLRMRRLNLLNIVALLLLYAKTYYLTNGDFELWTRYNVWI